MLIGINANPTQGFTADELISLKVQAVRFPLWRGHQERYAAFARDAQAAGLQLLPVLDFRSFTPAGLASRDRIERRVHWWRSILGPTAPVLAWQFGNEPDQPNSPSSWKMEPGAFSSLLRSARCVLGEDTRILAGGLVSGNPAYLDGVDLSPVDAIAIHPYTQTPETIELLLDLYQTKLREMGVRQPASRRPWITELGAPRDAFNSEHEHALWHSHMIAKLAELTIPACFVFCYSDLMAPGFGLVDENRNPYESYAAVANASQPPPSIRPPHILEIPGVRAGRFGAAPHGVILHATRSGKAQSANDEFTATCGFVKGGAAGLGWHITVGPGVIAVHMSPQEWGWNARSQSRDYLAIEFAQGTINDAITDDQLDAAAWWIEHVALHAWPDLPHVLAHHSEIPAGIVDGKTDVYPRGSARADEFRQRLTARVPGW